MEVVDQEPNKYNEIEYNDGSYIVDEKAIFLWKDGKKYYPTAIWREGNPQPFDFKHENKGIPAKVLNNILAPRIYRMLARGDEHPYLIAIIILIIVNLVFTIISFSNVFHLW